MAHHNKVVINHTGDGNQAPITGLQLSGDTDVTQNIIEWISPFDVRVKQDKVLGDRESGTGTWFLESRKFVDWVNGHTKILWCHGIPGSGKTVMSAVVTEYLKTYFQADQQVGVACVYCEYKQNQSQTPSSLLASIWRQLCQHKNSQAMQDKYGAYAQSRSSLPLAEIESITAEATEEYSRVLIVVDAIDECTEDNLNRTKFVQALQTLVTGRPSIRGRIHLMITSRQEEALIPGGDSIEIDAHGEDLERLIQKRIADGISQDKRVSQKLRSDAELAKKLAEDIVKGAGKMFLLVKLHLDALSPITNLRDLIAATKRLPRNLHHMYDDIWLRINAQDDHMSSLARNILSWIWCASRQLTVQELQHALATRKGDKKLDEDGIESEDTCLSCCHGFVAIDHAGQIVRLVHYSAQEYLEQKASEYFPNAHTRSAETCLTYLMFSEFRSKPEGEADRPKGDETMDTNGLWLTNHYDSGWYVKHQRYQRSTEILLQRNPFLSYAAAFWGRHARGQPEEVLQNEILNFVRTAAALANSVKITYNDGGQGLYHRLLPGVAPLVRGLSLFVAIYFGMKTTTQRLMEIPVIASSDGKDQSMLAWAVHCRQDLIARWLMENGADLGGLFKGLSVLWYAIDLDFVELITEIFRIRGPSLIGDSELCAAIDKDCVFIIQTYVEAAPDEISKIRRCNHVVNTAVMESLSGLDGICAVLDGKSPYRHDQVVDFALAAGGDLEATDSQGLTILQRSLSGGMRCLSKDIPRHHTVQRLLDRHANIEVLTRNRQSVLHLAAARGSSDVVQVLLQNRKDLLDINAYDEAGSTPLHYAIGKGYSLSALALIKYGADVDLNTRGVLTTLHIAAGCRGKTHRTLMTILDHSIIDIDVNIRDSQGMTPFHRAAEAKNLKSMQLLILAGANLNAEDSKGTTGLQMYSRLVPHVQRALAKGLDVTTVIYQNKTLSYLLATMQERKHMVDRVKQHARASTEDVNEMGRKQRTQRLLAEIDERIKQDFGGCDIQQLRHRIGRKHGFLNILESLCPRQRMVL